MNIFKKSLIWKHVWVWTIHILSNSGWLCTNPYTHQSCAVFIPAIRLHRQILRCQDGLRQLLAASTLSARGQVLHYFFCIKWVLHDCLGRNWDSLKQQTCEQWQWLLNLCKFMIIWGYTSKYIRDCDHVFMVVYFKAKIGCQHQHFG